MKKYLGILALILICGGLFALGLLLVDAISFERIVAYGQSHRVLGAVMLGGIMFTATVFAPLTVLPLVPLMAPILGPFTTMVASYVGWAGGAIVAFLVARKYGQSVVYRFIAKEQVDALSKYVTGDTGFFTLVALRIVLPVDGLSYALGLFTTVSFRAYTYSTLIGIFWFSCAFAYLGNSIAEGNYVLLAAVSVASIVILALAWRYIARNRKAQDKV